MQSCTRNKWLVTHAFSFCYLNNIVEQVEYPLMETNIYTWIMLSDEVFSYQIINNISFQPNPVFIPSCFVVWSVTMPVSGEKNNNGSALISRCLQLSDSKMPFPFVI